jgi:hypothetical protein
MMGIKEYETVKTALLVEWNKIADQVPTALKDVVDAGIAAVTGALGKAQNEIISLLDNGDISDDYRRRKMDEVKQMVVETYTAEVEKMNEALQKEAQRLQEVLTVPPPSVHSLKKWPRLPNGVDIKISLPPDTANMGLTAK